MEEGMWIVGGVVSLAATTGRRGAAVGDDDGGSGFLGIALATTDGGLSTTGVV